MNDEDGNGDGLDHYRASPARVKSVVKQIMEQNSGKKKDNEPIHAALDPDLDENMMSSGSDGALIRNHALLHYMATLANSNSQTDKFDYVFVQSLLDGGANINEAVDVHGQTIFHEVSRSWNLDVAAFLLENGADINQQDKYGRSPLHVCAASDHCDMVEFLLKNDANIDARSSGDEQTPLHFAAKNDATLSLKALLGFGANIDSLDSRGRAPLQVAAELSRSATARILIEEGASSCVYDKNGNCALTVLVEKLPDLALEALDQLHLTDTITRNELFYLNLLEESRQKKDTKTARTPLETAVNCRQFDVLMHPVMQRLVAVKWQQYGKFGTMLDLVINLMYAILFTIFAVGTPDNGEDLYLPLKYKVWRIIVGLILILVTAYQMYLQIKTTIESRQKQKSWIKWRVQQLKDDLQYCHPKWLEEKYIRDEMKIIKGLPLLSTIDAWFFFDWLIIILILVGIALNFSYFRINSSSLGSAYLRVLSVLLILVWLRILKYLRPFPGIGTLVLILGATGGDFINWGFFFLLLFIPFTASFWIIFGDKAEKSVSGFAKPSRLIYTMIQISVGEDFNLEGIVNADPHMARLLSTLYITLMVIVCLNILIAYLSNTFTSVYSKAVENTSMQRAINILNIEKFLPKSRKRKYFQFLLENASPEIVPSSAIDMSDKRSGFKAAEQTQKDFKKTHEILTQRFKKRVGRGEQSAFDLLLRDVTKLRRNQNDMEQDLGEIEKNLAYLGGILFGNSWEALKTVRESIILTQNSDRNKQRIHSRKTLPLKEKEKEPEPQRKNASSMTRFWKSKTGNKNGEESDDDGSVENGDKKPEESNQEDSYESEKKLKNKGVGKTTRRNDSDTNEDGIQRLNQRQQGTSQRPQHTGAESPGTSQQYEEEREVYKYPSRHDPKSQRSRRVHFQPQPPNPARGVGRTRNEVGRPHHNMTSAPLVPYVQSDNLGHGNFGFDDDSYFPGGVDSWEKISVDSISL